MNILMLSDVYKPLVNGVTFSIQLIADQLSNRGHTVTIVSPDYPNWIQEANSVRLKSISFPTYPEQRVIIPFFKKQLNQLNNKKFDIIHLHTPFTAGWFGIRLGKKLNLPIVYSFHTHYEKYVHYFPLPKVITQPLSLYLIKKFCNACDRLIAPSVEIRNIMVEYGVTKPIYLLPTPIDKSSFNQNYTVSPYHQHLNLPKDAKICLYVGRLAQEKNLLFLLKSFKVIRDHSVNSYLILIGDGPLRIKLKKISKKLKISDRVIFLGIVNRSDLSNWYHFADVFLFTSLSETQGLTVFEALYFGCPAVIVEGPGTNHAVIDSVNGFITPLDENAFAEKALRILNDSSLQTKFRANAKCIDDYFDVNLMTDKLLTIYNAIS